MDCICASARRPTCYFQAMGMDECFHSTPIIASPCDMSYRLKIRFFLWILVKGKNTLEKVLQFSPSLDNYRQGAFQQGIKQRTAAVMLFHPCIDQV